MSLESFMRAEVRLHGLIAEAISRHEDGSPARATAAHPEAALRHCIQILHDLDMPAWLRGNEIRIEQGGVIRIRGRK